MEIKVDVINNVRGEDVSPIGVRKVGSLLANNILIIEKTKVVVRSDTTTNNNNNVQ